MMNPGLDIVNMFDMHLSFVIRDNRIYTYMYNFDPQWGLLYIYKWPVGQRNMTPTAAIYQVGCIIFKHRALTNEQWAFTGNHADYFYFLLISHQPRNLID